MSFGISLMPRARISKAIVLVRAFGIILCTASTRNALHSCSHRVLFGGYLRKCTRWSPPIFLYRAPVIHNIQKSTRWDILIFLPRAPVIHNIQKSTRWDILTFLPRAPADQISPKCQKSGHLVKMSALSLCIFTFVDELPYLLLALFFF